AATTIVVMNACNQPESCDDVICQNNGICVEGTCECPDGFSGPNCEISTFENGVFVLNEGNFNGGNASLSFYNKNTSMLSNGVFTSVNTIPLGDVAQSMEIRDGKGYIVVNNSGKIEVVNLSDLSSAGTITGLSSPRYITFISNTKAYVSDLFSGTISSFNPQTLAVSGGVSFNGQVEQMVVVDGSVIAAGAGANMVYKIDPATDALTDSVDVGKGPANLVVDANGKVWVMTNGGFGTEMPKLVRVNPADMSVELSLSFSQDNYSPDLEISGDGNTLYYIDGQVFQMDISSSSLPSAPFATAFAYKCGVDPIEGLVYVSDAGDFNSNGNVYRYQSDGTAVDTFDLSVIPAEFAFTD
ncbi:MAG: DUF5074 domain-containing protein, partial [Flavobacteriales bacterium]